MTFNNNNWDQASRTAKTMITDIQSYILYIGDSKQSFEQFKKDMKWCLGTHQSEQQMIGKYIELTGLTNDPAILSTLI